VGRLVEFGRAIKITHRIFAKSMLIQVYYCVIQYKRNLKTERYVNVQVVLLFTLFIIYQDYLFEEFLKYEDGDILESS
jgi:hypothetical protein